jgi:predicted amidophosphoribosyltransferase
MTCRSCGRKTRKHSICGPCKADAKRWDRLREKVRKQQQTSQPQRSKEAANG